jgi:hypothetical protein
VIPRFALWDVVLVDREVRGVGGLEGTVTSPPVPTDEGTVVYRVFLGAIEEGRTLPEEALRWTGRVDREAHALATTHADRVGAWRRARRRRAYRLQQRLRTPERRRARRPARPSRGRP